MILDRHINLGNECIFINENVEISGLDEVSKNALQNSVRKNGTIKTIKCSEITDMIKETVRKQLGVEYTKNQDAYIICISEEEIIIYSETESGAFYGAVYLARRCRSGIGRGIIYNYPCVPFRMLKLYLPSEDNIECFKELVDLSAYYGYNKIMLEIGGAMEYKSHPEIGEGWKEYSRTTSEHINKKGNNPYFPYSNEHVYFLKNSIHCENGDGGVLSQQRVKELILYCQQRFMEVIPEMPSLSHSDYLLTRHPELAERKDDIYPDTYCPKNPKTYELLFDLLSEVIEVFKPKRMNIGHDEVFSLCVCDKCKSEDPAVLYAEDIIKIHGFLKEHNVKTMMWAEELINCTDKTGVAWAGARREIKHPKTGELAQIIRPVHPAIDLIPKDVELLHWYWSIEQQMEKEFKDRGFWVSFGNFEPLRVKNIINRLNYGIDGVGISNWSKVDELHVQRNGIYYNLAHTAMILWNNDNYDDSRTDENIQKAASDLYHYRVDRAKYKAEILHSFTKDIPFELYLDGYEVDEEKNIIGEYIVEFSDGTRASYPAEYGKTIGFIGVSRCYSDSDWCDSLDPDNRIIEPTYSCELEFQDDKTYYRYAVTSTQKIVNLEMKVKPEYRDFVSIKEINII